MAFRLDGAAQGPYRAFEMQLRPCRGSSRPGEVPEMLRFLPCALAIITALRSRASSRVLVPIGSKRVNGRRPCEAFPSLSCRAFADVAALSRPAQSREPNSWAVQERG